MKWVDAIRRHRARTKAIMDDLLKDQEQYQGKTGQDLKRFWKENLGPYRSRLAIAFAIAGVWGALPLMFPLAGRYLVDQVLMVQTGFPPSELERQFRRLLLYVSMIGGIWFLLPFCQWVQSRIMLTTGERVVFSLREQLNRKLQSLHIGYYERTPVGRIMSRILNDVGMIRIWVSGQSTHLIASVTKVVLGVTLAFYLNWKLSLLVLASLPFYAWGFRILQPQIRRISVSLRRLNSRMYAKASERVSGIHVIKAFGRERGELSAFAPMVFDSVRLGSLLATQNQLLQLFAGLIYASVTGVIVYATALFVKSGAMTLGDLMAFYRILPGLFAPVNFLTSMASQSQGILVAIRRVFNLLDEKIEITPGSIELTGMVGRIHFDHVTFTYPGHQDPALDKVEFRVDPGEKIAIMGPSGSGKSTLFQLLLRFYDPDNGAVRVGGVNLMDADPRSIRHHICMVQQEPEIFSGTVGENIAYGHLDATPRQIMDTAKLAELHDFILELPVKYETEVGERGVSLSGGQKQRLALATALLTNPEVLLLDDTGSALDSETETRIRATLRKVLKNRTSLIITQRIPTARDCDRIVVFENGRITQSGTHLELARQKGFYKRICEMQGWKEREAEAGREESSTATNQAG